MVVVMFVGWSMEREHGSHSEVVPTLCVCRAGTRLDGHEECGQLLFLTNQRWNWNA